MIQSVLIHTHLGLQVCPLRVTGPGSLHKLMVFRGLPRSCWEFRSLSHSLTDSHARSRSLAHSLFLSPSLPPHALSLTLFLSLSPSIPPSRLSLSLSLSLYLPPPPPPCPLSLPLSLPPPPPSVCISDFLASFCLRPPTPPFPLPTSAVIMVDRYLRQKNRYYLVCVCVCSLLVKGIYSAL